MVRKLSRENSGLPFFVILILLLMETAGYFVQTIF